MFDFMGKGMILADINVNGTLTFTSANIVDGGLSLNRYSTSAIAPEFGNVSAGELTILIDTSTIICNVERGDVVTGRWYVASEPTTEGEFGEFIVTNVIKGSDTVEITCLDKMILLDGEADLTGITYPINASDFIDEVYGTGLGLTVEILTDVDTSLGDPLFETGTTYRQVLSKVCECIGANAWYKDKLYIGWYEEVQATADDELYISADLTETAFSISVEATKDYTKKPVEITDDVITLRIVDNPFLAEYTDAQLETLASAIETNIGNVSWYGGNVTILPSPDLDVMNIITVVDKDGNNRAFPLTSVTYGINENTKLESKISSEDNDYNGTLTRDVETLKREIEDVEENNKHFFYRDDSGVHVTMTENDWTTGQNLLMNSTYVDVRDGTTSLASFGTPTRIGEIGKARTEISPTKFSIYSDNNDEAMRVTSVATINVPVCESFSVGTNIRTTTLNYTTPVLAHTIYWGTLRADITAGFTAEGKTITWTPISLSFGNASATPTATYTNPYSGTTIFKVTGSIVGGNKVKFAITNIDTDAYGGDLFINADVSYTYTATGNTTVTLASDPPSLELYNPRHQTTPSNGAISRIRAYASDSRYGNNLTIQSGGNLFLGGGEYAENRYAYNMGEKGGEDTYIGADGTVYVEANANTIGNRKTWSFNTDGSLNSPTSKVTLGTATTDQIVIWGNSTNKVGIGVTNNQEDARYNLIARETYFGLENPSGGTWCWYISRDNTNRLRIQQDTHSFHVRDGMIGLYSQTSAGWVWQLSGLDGTRNIANIGTTYEKTASTSLASGTAKNITSQSFAVGTWLVTGTAEFPSNATGRRAVQLSGTSGGDALSTQARSLVAPVNGGPTVAQFTFVLEVTATKTYYLVGYQNSGSALTTTGVINAVRIK